MTNMKVNLNLMEYMLYFWQSTSENEKVGESYLVEIAEQPEMALLYDETFNAESVRKVLSAITVSYTHLDNWRTLEKNCHFLDSTLYWQCLSAII